jgi:hypothetical protein
MATQSVAKQIAAVAKSAESMHAAATEKVETASAGDVVRQGDLYFVCLESPPPGQPLKSRQLAPGTTQGSRHIAVGNCAILETINKSALSVLINKLVRGASIPPELVGPVVECRGDTTIEHPEHGHRVLPAGSTWATVYQRAFGEEVRRAQD